MKNRTDCWYEETGVSSTVFYYPRKDNAPIVGCGIAECHPDDKEFMSERTGGAISEYRAMIDLCKKIIQDELKPGLAALKHLKGTMAISKNYNPNSYEAKRLDKEIKNIQKEIEDTKEMIQITSIDLTNYINLKKHLKEQAKNK